MSVSPRYARDVEAILSHRHDLGGDLWTTPDLRLGKGAPFSLLESVSYLLELGMDPGDPVLRAAAELIFRAWREDGRIPLYRGGAYPCHTAAAVNVLCALGCGGDPRVERTLRHLLDTQHGDGGWRCNKFSYGRGPETAYSNPHPTLVALDAFRRVSRPDALPALERAAAFLLEHWSIRAPIGPCHYGIGTLFMQVSYPFRDYNLFYYVYVLSFYPAARRDPRFREALDLLSSRLSDGQVVVERVVPKLSGLDFCRKGAPSALATARYREILSNLAPDAALPSDPLSS